MPLLPHVSSPDEYRNALRETAAFVQAVGLVAREHGLPGAPPERFTNGSSPVFALGDALVVKFYAALYHDTFLGEVAALRHVHGRVGMATPGVIASGEMDGWGYVVMERVRGCDMREAWDEMGRDDQLSVVRRTGEAAARLHAIPAEGVGEALRVDWPAFVARQTETAVEKHREAGLGEEWLRQIPAWLETVELEPAEANPSPVLLHTELMRDHVLVAPAGGGGWEVTGLIDFEPSMVGHRDYEMASVGLFISRGDPELFSAFLRGYGTDPRSVTREARRRWLAWTLLHRYGKLSWYLEFMPATERRTLDALAERWWATE